MNQTSVQEQLDPDVRNRIQTALDRHQAEAGGVPMSVDRARRSGERLVVTVLPEGRPRMFSYFHAVAGAEIDLRDSGMDVELKPEFREDYVVVAHIEGEPQPYIYVSSEGREYEDLSKLLSRSLDPETATIEGYPFHAPDEEKQAWAAAVEEYPSAIQLSEPAA